MCPSVCGHADGEEMMKWDSKLTKSSINGASEKKPSDAIHEKIVGSSWKSTQATTYADDIKGKISEFETSWATARDNTWMVWHGEEEQLDDEGDQAWKTNTDL
jgi:hypothetical protein